MKKLLHTLPTLLLMLLVLGISPEIEAQILVQDFETLNSLSEFAAASPSKEQVDALLESSTENQTVFSLYEMPGSGQTMLRLDKGGRNRVWFIKENGDPNPAVLKLQFKMMVSEPTSAAKTGDIGSFYIGNDLKMDGTYPLNASRFATIDVSWEGGDNFSISNIIAGDPDGSNEQVEGTFTTSGLSKVAIFMNNSGALYSYVSPQGEQEDIGNGKIDIWVNNNKVVDEVSARAAAPMQAIKFVSRNNTLTGQAFFDNFLVEAVPAYVAPPELDEAGGNYTVGTGGDFTSLTNPGGVFQALNELGAIAGPFNFSIISDLVEETGQVPLNEIAGASEVNSIQFRAQDQTTYTISGANDIAAGALISLNGADWVRFDGRELTETQEGMGVAGYLQFRNAGSAPTFYFYNDATNNAIAYSNVQGASASAEQGVIFLGNGTSTGNDSNSFRYNRIGGYGTQSPVNALTSRNTSAGNLSEEILVEGNQFYGFAASASLSGSGPCSILAANGSSKWVIFNNHFFQERQGFPVVGEGRLDLQGICLRAGTNHRLEGNFIGGSAPFAGGTPLTVVASGNVGTYPSVIPFSIETRNGVVDIIGNTVTNIDVTGIPFGSGCDNLGFGAVAMAGEVNFIDNTFGDPNGQTFITARNGYTNMTDGSTYLVAPIYYRARGSNTTSGRVVNNFIGAVRLEGNSPGASGVHFRGILNNQNAFISEISQNTITDIQSSVGGEMGVSIVGIHARGRGDIDIFRNVLYDFVNNSSAQRAGCPLANISRVNTMGIVADNVTGQTTVANNMLTLRDTRAESTTVYYGIFVPSNSPADANIFYNSVYVYGGDNAAIGSSYVFLRTGASPTTVRNNIFLNTRITDNANFVIGTDDPIGWTSGHNLLYQESGDPNIQDFGLFGALLIGSCEEWTSLNESQQQSICANVEGDFIDPENGNLRIVQTDPLSPVVDAGFPIEEVETDIDFALRIEPDIGASEGFNTWIGVISTDWFNPGNWSANVVPSCGGNPDLLGQNRVSIVPNGTRIFDDVVQFQPVIEGAAPAFYRNIIIMEDASVTIGDPRAKLMQCAGRLNPLLEGITNRGTIEYAKPGRISLRGVLNNEGEFIPGMGTLSLMGDTLQNINSTEDLQVWRVLVEGGGDKNLLNNVIVLNTLDLVEGIVLSSADSTLIMEVGASLGEEGSPDNDAYVAGPMIKRFNSTDEFVFPVGDENQLGRAALIPASDNVVSFVVEYHFDSPPFPTVSTAETEQFFQDGIIRVSQNEYWTIARIEGSVDAQVVLYWDENSGVESIADKDQDLSVVRWNATIPAWVNEGNDGFEDAPAPALGRLFSAPQVSGFGVFTFGTPNPDVPLPVDLVSFTAILEQQDVKLAWETSMELNSSHFNVQRSQDGQVFETIGKVASSGNSEVSVHYQFTDDGVGKELAGTIYYRLEQVDIDGTTDYSPLVAVELPDEAFSIRGVYPNPFKENLVLNIKGSKEQRIKLRLLDMNGRQLLSQQLEVKAGDNIMPVLGAQQLEIGLYILEVSAAGEIRQFKVVKK